MLRVVLTMRLYMMRYGTALLASSYTNANRPTFTEDVSKNIAAFLTEGRDVPASAVKPLESYVKRKPGSPRYTRLRRELAAAQSVKAEHQDILLSNPKLESSVGALTRDYFDDALALAHALRLVRKNHNMLLARGRMSLSTGWSQDNPFQLGHRDALYLGMWLLDVDGDWGVRIPQADT